MTLLARRARLELLLFSGGVDYQAKKLIPPPQIWLNLISSRVSLLSGHDGFVGPVFDSA
jgi:hypothetical protein